MRRVLGIVALAMVAPSMAAADLCQARIEAVDLEIDPEMLAADATWRESLLSLPRLSRKRQCNSAEIYAFMEGLADLDGKCLAYADADTGFVFMTGTRNFRGRCTKTGCERVNDTKENLGALTAAIWGKVANISDNPTGAVIVSGASDTILSAVGTGSSAALAALSTPSVLAATTVSAVAVGGAVYICAD